MLEFFAPFIEGIVSVLDAELFDEESFTDESQDAIPSFDHVYIDFPDAAFVIASAAL
jgi:hypothetical protein